MVAGLVDYQETYSSDTFEVRDTTGVLADAGTTTVTVLLPDGTTSSPTVNHPSLGTYTFDYLTTIPGLHRFRFHATGGTLGTLVRRFADGFVVRPDMPAMGISLSDARNHLNEQSRLQDEEIRAYVEVATEIVEGLAGKPIVARTYTERVRNATFVFKLMKTPVQSVTSVTSIYAPTFSYAPTDLDVDTAYGHVYLLSGSSFSNAPFTVVYKAGVSDVPARYVHAIKEQLWHMWVTQRGQLADTTTPDLLDVADFETRGQPFGLGFLIPARVRELVDFELAVPGVA